MLHQLDNHGKLELSSTVCVRMQLQGILHVGYSFNLLFDNHLATIYIYIYHARLYNLYSYVQSLFVTGPERTSLIYTKYT